MVGAVCTGLAWRDGAKGNGMVGPTYRLCGAERGGILLVALVRRLLEEGEGPRELKRVRFYDGGHRSARLRWGRQHPAELPVRRSIRGERPALPSEPAKLTDKSLSYLIHTNRYAF